MEVEVYEANVRVRALPRDVDRKLNIIASRDSKLKWEVVREALIEYVERHGGDIR